MATSASLSLLMICSAVCFLLAIFTPLSFRPRTNITPGPVLGGRSLPEDFRQRRLDDVQEFSESCSGVAVREAFREIFVLPSSIVNGIGATHMIGVALVMILAASVPGSEYGWGTLRNALTRGVGRWQFLASKLLLLALVGVAVLLVVSVLNAVSSLIAAAIPPDEAGGLFDSGEWSDAAVMFGKAFYGLVPYITLGVFLAVLTQSSASGISFSLGYYVVEMIVTPFLTLASWLESVPDYLIGQNVSLWMSEAALLSVETSNGVSASQPSTLHAFLVILVYNPGARRGRLLVVPAQGHQWREGELTNSQKAAFRCGLSPVSLKYRTVPSL